MTTYSPFDALRVRLREARAQGRRVTSPTLARQRFQVVVDTVIGPMLRHVAHVLWQEGGPRLGDHRIGCGSAACSGTPGGGGFCHLFLGDGRSRPTALGHPLWQRVWPDPFPTLRLSHGGSLGSLLEQTTAALLMLSTSTGERTVQTSNSASSGAGDTSHQEPRL